MWSNLQLAFFSLKKTTFFELEKFQSGQWNSKTESGHWTLSFFEIPVGFATWTRRGVLSKSNGHWAAKWKIMVLIVSSKKTMFHSRYLTVFAYDQTCSTSQVYSQFLIGQCVKNGWFCPRWSAKTYHLFYPCIRASPAYWSCCNCMMCDGQWMFGYSCWLSDMKLATWSYFQSKSFE